jgi:hypothetical protein
MTFLIARMHAGHPPRRSGPSVSVRRAGLAAARGLSGPLIAGCAGRGVRFGMWALGVCRAVAAKAARLWVALVVQPSEGQVQHPINDPTAYSHGKDASERRAFHPSRSARHNGKPLGAEATSPRTHYARGRKKMCGTGHPVPHGKL